jgi:hypothetical protein
MRAYKLVEASFDPSGEFRVGDLPDRPSSPNFDSNPPDPEDYELSQINAYFEAVKLFATDVERFQREVETYEKEVEKYTEEVDGIYENADVPELLNSFRGGDVHREMDQAGLLSGDEVVVLLRGDYDRLVHAANEDCACKFDSAGKCIHRGCGLTAADWAEVEVA